NDHSAEYFDVIDISKLKTVLAETVVSLNVPPSTHQIPQKPKRFAFQTEGGMERKKVCANQELSDGTAVCEYCGHVRCDKCLPDKWEQLADGSVIAGHAFLHDSDGGLTNGLPAKNLPRAVCRRTC